MGFHLDLKFMRKFIFFAVVLLFTGTSWAQNIPIDFERSDHNFSAFGGAQFTRDKDPLSANNNVGHITNIGVDKFEGVFIDLQNGLQLDSAKKIYFSVYHAEGDSFTFQIKLEKNTNGEPDIYVQKTIKNSNWHYDSFDFSKAKVVGTNAVVNGKGRYNRITLFFEPNQLKSGDYYIDDIRDFASKLPPTSSGTMPVYDKLVWSDEFDYAGKPNPMKWHHQVVPPNNGGWFNNEIQHYTDKRDNSFVGDGSMKIDYVRVYQKAITTAVNGAPNETGALLYPNPTSDKLFVKEMGRFTSYAISDMNGRILQSGSLGGQADIDVSKLAAGLYQLSLKARDQLVSSGSNAIFRFVKE